MSNRSAPKVAALMWKYIDYMFWLYSELLTVKGVFSTVYDLEGFTINTIE